MLKTDWLFGLALVALITPACTTKTSLGSEGEDGGRNVGSGLDTPPATGCTYAPVSLDLSCNDDPNLPTAAGACEPDATCRCAPGFVLNPVSKRCKLDTTVDGGAVICTVGADQTCNDDPLSAQISGTCVGGVACACKTGYLMNVKTGRCKRAPVTDAGSDAPVGVVCTPLLDQTCNDDDTFSGTAGHCMKGFSCSCNDGFVLNPATGRCRAGSKPDAAVTPAPDAWVGNDTGSAVVDAFVGKDLGKDAAGVCTFGKNQTCNDDSWASWVAGTCQSDGTCVCASGYVMNPSSGRCAYVPKDAGPDVTAGVCTPGMNQTCNDDPVSAAVMGVCQANGTCSCNSGYVLNTATGKCMRPATICSGNYLACGCGCCGGTTPQVLCYYPSAGDSLSTVIAADEAVKNDKAKCEMAGCSLGQRYVCCHEAAAEPAGSAQYSASFIAGGYDRISIKKTGNDGNCMQLTLVSPVPTGSSNPLRVSTPARWAIEAPIFKSTCGSSGTSEQAIGAQGTVTYVPNGTSCALGVHLTVFFYSTASGGTSTARFDAEDIPVSGGVSSGYCQ